MLLQIAVGAVPGPVGQQSGHDLVAAESGHAQTQQNQNGCNMSLHNGPFLSPPGGTHTAARPDVRRPTPFYYKYWFPWNQYCFFMKNMLHFCQE
jgi:hypothetical protein